MDKLCVKFDDHLDNIATSFKKLMESNDFSDVTLVCEDNHHIDAHRVILSASSPIFMKMLISNKHKNPLIYMRGLKAKNMLSILDFIYHGEANIYQEDLNQFLSLAEELQLKGLIGNDKEEHIQDSQKTFKPDKEKRKTNYIKEHKTTHQIHIKGEVLDNPILEHDINDIPVNNTLKVAIDNDSSLDEQINTMFKGETNNWTCSICGKNSKHKANIRQHIEANHIEGVVHPCDQCKEISRTRCGLLKHISRRHTSKQSVNIK